MDSHAVAVKLESLFPIYDGFCGFVVLFFCPLLAMNCLKEGDPSLFGRTLLACPAYTFQLVYLIISFVVTALIETEPRIPVELAIISLRYQKWLTLVRESCPPTWSVSSQLICAIQCLCYFPFLLFDELRHIFAHQSRSTLWKLPCRDRDFRNTSKSVVARQCSRSFEFQVRSDELLYVALQILLILLNNILAFFVHMLGFASEGI